MGLLQALESFFSKTPDEVAGQAPEGLCANCWGHYEYDGEVRQLARDHQIDIQNGVARRNFIEKVVVKHVEGIRLRDADHGAGCPRCKKHQHRSG